MTAVTSPAVMGTPAAIWLEYKTSVWNRYLICVTAVENCLGGVQFVIVTVHAFG